MYIYVHKYIHTYIHSFSRTCIHRERLINKFEVTRKVFAIIHKKEAPAEECIHGEVMESAFDIFSKYISACATPAIEKKSSQMDGKLPSR